MKLHPNPKGPSPGGTSPECSGPDDRYDLRKEPWETTNLIRHPSYRDAARTLRQRLLHRMETTRDPALALFKRHKIEFHDLGVDTEDMKGSTT